MTRAQIEIPLPTRALAGRLALLISVLMLWPPGLALADCEDGVAALTAATAAATDPHIREVLARELNQAQTDLWEFDEVECAVSLARAARFLKRQGSTASSAAPGN